MSIEVMHSGGCHCGAVKFEFDAPSEVVVYHCNCSMCIKTGYQHLTVAKTAFRLMQGQESLSEYSFNTGVAKHLFCRICGIKSFYIPRSHPNGYSINMRCVDQSSFERISFEQFDGENWEANIDQLREATKDSS